MKIYVFGTLILIAALTVSACGGGGSNGNSNGAGGSDTTPPVISNVLPSGQQVAGTTSVSMQATTNANATCKYSLTDVTYASMTNTFSTTGSAAHSQTISGLQNGQSYTYYVRCRDTTGNENTSSTTIAWSVAQSGSGTAILNWGASPVDASHSAPDGYKVYHSTAPGAPYKYYDQVGRNILTYQATALSSGTHCFAATAFNSAGESSYSACSSGNCCKTIP